MNEEIMFPAQTEILFILPHNQTTLKYSESLLKIYSYRMHPPVRMETWRVRMCGKLAYQWKKFAGAIAIAIAYLAYSHCVHSV